MRITIKNKSSYEKEFIYDAIPSFMYNILDNIIDYDRATRLSKDIKLDVINALKIAISTLYVHEDPSYYYIDINPYKKFNNHKLQHVIKIISFGNLSVKGYPIIDSLFKIVNENVDGLYSRWLNGRL